MTSTPSPATHDSSALRREISRLLTEEQVVFDASSLRLASQDATSGRGVQGNAEAVIFPESADELAKVVAWCYEHDVAMVPRGGGSGLAGGAVPSGGVVISTERIDTIRSIDPEYWRMEVECGVRTDRVQRVARENGLLFPPDPGAGEQSTIGGNMATNAGGPHAFKYGVTGAWVTGLQVVLPQGEQITVGGALRKDVAGLDLKRLFIGSEGALGFITSAWLRLIPAPESRSIVVAFYENTEIGCDAIAMIMGSGIQPTALEYLDGGALAASVGSFPGTPPAGAGFAVIAEADGSPEEVERVTADLIEAMSDNAQGEVLRFATPSETREFWTWRDGVSIAVTARRGGKISEDIAVPIDRLAEAIEGTFEIGDEFDLEACSWGHAGDGNLHATFLVDLADPSEVERANDAAAEVFNMAIRLNGSISGEHGIGILKAGKVGQALDPEVVALQIAIKDMFDPKHLMNPGKKIPLG